MDANSTKCSSTEDEETRHTFVIAIQFFLSCTSTINVICYVFIVVCIVRHPGLQTITNYFLFSTGVSHIFFQFMSLVVVSFADNLCEIGNPQALITFSFNAMISVFGNTILVAMETYLKVCHPFWYVRVITEKKSFLLIGTTWAFCLVSGILASSFLSYYETSNEGCCPIGRLTQANKQNVTILVNVLIVPSLLALTIFKILVIRTAREQARVIAMHEENLSRQNPVEAAEGRQKVKRLRKSTKNLFIFVGTYIAGWLPLLIMVNVAAFCLSCGKSGTSLVINFVVIANMTSIGPLLFTFRQPEFARLISLYKQRVKESMSCGSGD